MEAKVIEILKDLIAIPSYVDETHGEKAIGDYIYDFLSKNTKLTIEKQLVENDRFNVIAYFDLEPEIVFFSHMDTVPPKVENSDPFTPKIIDGKLYGLGSVDMKAGLATALEIARTTDSKKIAYVFSVDEEYEFKGTLKLVTEYTFRPKIIINLEPTSLKLLNGCRGVTEFTFEVHGRSAHAGRKHLGINAIEKACELFNDLQNEISELNGEGGSNSLNLAHINGGVLKEGGVVGYSGNVVPNYAFCVGEIRIANKQITEEWIKDKIISLSENLGIVCDNFIFKFLMSAAFTPKNKLTSFEDAMRENGLEPEYMSIDLSGYFEVQILQERWDADIIVFGPGPSAQAHQVNEYVEIATVLKTLDVIRTYINKKVTP